jgi:uncharacterized protein
MLYQRTVLSRILPFVIYILFLALSDALSVALTWLHIDTKWAYVFRIVVVLSLLIYFWKDYIELKVRPRFYDFFYAAIAGSLVFIVWIFPYPTWLGASDSISFNPFVHENQLATYGWMAARMFGAAMMVPIMEELFWRSFMMRWFDKDDFMSVSPERVSGYAFLGSSLLFASEHHLWLAGLFAGFVYAELYKNYKNLWVPIFAHAVTNGLLGVWVITTESWHYW